MVSVSIIGASGYTGGELIRILANHPGVESIDAISRTYAGKKVSGVHQNLFRIFDEKFKGIDSKIDSDVVFTCTPNGQAMEIAPSLLKRGIKVIDLSADYRLDMDTYEKVYGIEHKSPGLIKEAVNGFPELFRERIKKANLIANPGCYVISAVLGITPLKKFKDKLDPDKVIVDSKSGTSGAGAGLSEFLHHAEVHDNLKPYNVIGHRHQPEMEQLLRNFFKIKISFTPTLMPIVRGILTNVHVFGNLKDIDLKEHYKNFYKEEKFVRIVDLPYIKNVVNTNYCDIGVHFDPHCNRILIISAIDNLIKGASGQAVQNMNLMLGFDERMGLELIACHP